jgi:dihydroxyacetone kinase-like predicted kinase
VTSASEVRFQFCSQIQICGTKVDRVALKSALRPFGDSLIVAGTEELVHVHIHTNEFEEVLKIAGNYGRIENCNKQDMRQQSRLLSEPSGRQKIAIITDSSCDLPADEIISRHIRVVPCRVIFGNESYLDKVTITPTNFYRMLSTSEVHPKTSQPAPADFRDACLGAAAQHDTAIAWSSWADATPGSRARRQTRADTRPNSTCPGRVGPSRRQSDVAAKGRRFAAGRAIFRGYQPPIPLTVAYSAIFVTTGQEQHGNRMKILSRPRRAGGGKHGRSVVVVWRWTSTSG